MGHHTHIAAIAVIIFAGFLSAAARADEAYVCDVGRVVYVKPGELEHLKRTDPCIAGYYGLVVEKNSAVPHSSQGAVTAGPGLSLLAVGKAVKGLNMERAARRQFAAPTHLAATELSRSATHVAPGADFRNVVIINAAAGKDRIFRHEK